MTEDPEYENPIIEDRTDEVTCELMTENRPRYEEEATAFLLDSTLEVQVRNAIIRNRLKRNCVETEISFDQGKSFRVFYLSRLPDKDSEKRHTLIWHFAASEAFAILALEEQQGHL
jgi:CRISPR/Cas system type I-B associated protein Csh2 (Cas7 group RAMP superfamily)